jgi:hypothetical protein
LASHARKRDAAEALFYILFCENFAKSIVYNLIYGDILYIREISAKVRTSERTCAWTGSPRKPYTWVPRKINARVTFLFREEWSFPDEQK